MAILTSAKVDFKTKAIVRDKEGQYTVTENKPTRGYNPSKHLCSHIGAPEYAELIWMDTQGESDRNNIKAGDFNTPLTSTDRSFRQKTNKDAAALNQQPLDQMDLIDLFPAFYSKAAEYMYF